jgi:hypothetical protein
VAQQSKQSRALRTPEETRQNFDDLNKSYDNRRLSQIRNEENGSSSYVQEEAINNSKLLLV